VIFKNRSTPEKVYIPKTLPDSFVMELSSENIAGKESHLLV